MKNNRFRIVSLLLAVGIAAGLFGCGNQGKESGHKAAEEKDAVLSGQKDGSEDSKGSGQQGMQGEMSGNYYSGEYDTLLETGSVDKAAAGETAVYYYKWYAEGGKLFKYDLETKKTEQLPFYLGEREGIEDFDINEEGGLTVVKYVVDEADESLFHYYIITLDKEGGLLMEQDITDFVQEERDLTSNPYVYLYGAAPGKDGRVCVHSLFRVWVFDREGNFEFSVDTPENYICNMGTLPDGEVAVSVYDLLGNKVQMLDFEKQDWGESYSDSHFDDSLAIAQSREGIYFYTEKELFSFDPESRTAAVTADWIKNDVLGDDLCHVSVFPDGNLRIVTSDATGNGGGTETAFLKLTDAGLREQREIITMGTIELTGGMRSAVTAFNKKNDKYRVEVIEYAQGKNYQEGTELFHAEAVAGNMPDVMNITDGTEEFYASKGIFEDLKPYLDGETGIRRSEYFDNILTAMETNGKLYALSPDFTVKTLVGKKSDVGEGYSWTLEDVAALKKARGGDVEMLDHEYGRKVFYLFLYYNMAQFFDLNAGVCDFDNEDFKGILEFAGQFPESNPYRDEDHGELKKAGEGELLLMEGEWSMIRNYSVYRRIFNADISCVGYPGNFPCGSLAKGGDVTLVMSEKSAQKEGAWEFIRFFLEEEYQNRYTTGFPVLLSAFDRKAAGEMWIDYETGEKQKSGSVISNADKEIQIVVEDATQEETAAVKELIGHIGRMERIDIQIINIAFEEADAYFAGQKSVDEVIDVIQSRAKIYMNENR